ncbi:hypothetical protein [Sphingomonas oleivorans]|uniref:hypothetical protein n=1 Tax=Sphingomonas oleivorans TaxID=1735121 RepID=UPI0013FDB836|nr:hypothetical protein [Sphingomonas oleivorans]
MSSLSLISFGRQARRDLLVATPHSRIVLSNDRSLGGFAPFGLSGGYYYACMGVKF